jgi:hypothetical protein
MPEPDVLTPQLMREIVGEATLRFERAMRALSSDVRREIEASRRESREYFEKLRVYDEAMLRRSDEQIEENRAQRQALLRILDKLGPETAT